MLLGLNLLNLIDIFLVALLLFYLYKMMRESGSLNLFLGILIFVVVWMLVSRVLEMPMLGSIFNALANVGVLALIVIFQNEIRHFFRELGSQKQFKKLFRFLSTRNRASGDQQDWLPLVRACQNMSDGKVGALIVVERDQHLGDFIETGERIDANINRMLIENLFFKNSPLHDGAMIISEGKIAAAACILPISHDLDIPKEFGLRHRAGKGITSETDALAIIVSEETGNITAAHNDQFRSHLTAEELETILMKGRF